MGKTFEITWQVDDGYAGKSRPQTSTIDFEDVRDFEGPTDIRYHICDVIQDNFEQTITWYSEGISELVTEIQQAIKEEIDNNIKDEADELREASDG